MDPAARDRLVALLADLPTARDREELARALAGTSTPAATHAEPTRHADAVVDALLADDADLRALFDRVRRGHPSLAARAQAVQSSLVEPQLDADDDAEGPTEMIDPAALAALRRTSVADAGAVDLAAGQPPPSEGAPVAAAERAPAAPTRPSAATPAPSTGQPSTGPWIVVAVVVAAILGLVWYWLAA